jgi:prevent-host-death family protein
MVQQIPIKQARAQLSSLIRNAAECGIVYEITHHGRPVAMLSRATEQRKRAFHLAERRLIKVLAEIAEYL